FDPNSNNRKPVAQIHFPQLDGARRYTKDGDSTRSETWSCKPVLYTGASCNAGTQTVSFAKKDAQHPDGDSKNLVVDEGVVILPSGHHLNALLLRNITEVGMFIDSGCNTSAGPGLRQVRCVWVVPRIGGVVALTSQDEIAPAELPNGWSTVKETMVAYGLLPPLSVTVTDTDDTKATLSWNPGAITSHISRYKIYWDTDSGAASSYAFNSDANPGQVSFSGTTATITGLTPNTTYYFTVTY